MHFSITVDGAACITRLRALAPRQRRTMRKRLADTGGTFRKTRSAFSFLEDKACILVRVVAVKIIGFRVCTLDIILPHSFTMALRLAVADLSSI